MSLVPSKQAHVLSCCRRDREAGIVMSRRAGAVLAGISVVGVLLIAGIAAWFAWQDSLYVKTDDANVAGPVVYVSPSAGGTLMTWTATMGRRVTAGAVLGTIQPDQGVLPAGVAARAPAPVEVPV